MQKTWSLSKFISLIVFIQLKPSLKNNQHKTGTKYLNKHGIDPRHEISNNVAF